MSKIRRHAKAILANVSTPFRPGNVVMFHLGRCGSTVVSNLLHQHHDIYWASELYEPIFGKWRKSNAGVEVVGKMPEDAIDILRSSSRQAIHHFYGFEMKPYHFRLIGYSPEDFLKHLDSIGFTHYIILDRKNRLRKIVSSIIAHHKGGYHIDGKSTSRLKSVNVDIGNVKIDFDSKPLIDYLKDYDNQFGELEALLEGKRLLKLNYEEDIQEDPKIAYLRICKFMNIPPEKVAVNLSKTNPFPLKDMIENFKEVKTTLSGTPYEWMLSD